jgi:DNA-binding XRE family transcriptional regulator
MSLTFILCHAFLPFVLDLDRRLLTIFPNFSHPMTHKAYHELRETLGTQSIVAKRLGVAERTIQRREKGELKIDREAEIAIHSLNSLKSLGSIINAPKLFFLITLAIENLFDFLDFC